MTSTIRSMPCDARSVRGCWKPARRGWSRSASRIATDAADLWDACTNIDRIPRWFLPITGDLKVGGQYQLEGNASGTILTCDPPRAFTATWEYGGDVSWIEVHVTDQGPDEARLRVGAHRARRRRHLAPVRAGRGGHRLGSGPGRAGHPPGHRGIPRSHVRAAVDRDRRRPSVHVAVQRGVVRRRTSRAGKTPRWPGPARIGARPPTSRRHKTRTRSSQAGRAGDILEAMHAQTPVQIAWVTHDLGATEAVLTGLLGAKKWIQAARLSTSVPTRAPTVASPPTSSPTSR